MSSRNQKTKGAAKAPASPAKSPTKPTKPKITKSKITSPLSKKKALLLHISMHPAGIMTAKFDKESREDYGDVYDWSIADPVLREDPAVAKLAICMITARVTPGTNDTIYGPPSADGKTYELRTFIRSIDDNCTPNDAKRWGEKIVNAYKAASKFETSPKVVIRDNRNKPVNHFIADDEVAKLVKHIYVEAVADESFWTDEELVAAFFGDLDSPQDLFEDDGNDSDGSA